MNGLRNFLLLGGIALSLGLPQLVFAADKTDDPAPIDYSKPRPSRGIVFSPINRHGAAGANVEAPMSIPVINEIHSPVNRTMSLPAAKSPLGHAALSGHSAAVGHPAGKKSSIITAVAKEPQAHKTVQNAQKHPAARVETASQNTGASALVKFHQTEGAVIAASLDRSGDSPRYKVGDKMMINVKANQDCNVVVFNYDSTGTLTQIFPNDYQQNGFVKSGETVQIGGSESPFDYQISGKGGPEKVFVYAYPTNSDNNKLPITVAMNPVAGSPFRSTEMTVEQYRDLVNGSKVYFERTRGVQVVPRKTGIASSTQTTQLASSASQPSAPPNKVELSFSVDK